MRRKTVLFEHTMYTFTPIAESGQFRPARSGRVGDRLTMICKIPSSSQGHHTQPVQPHTQDPRAVILSERYISHISITLTN